MLFHTLDFAVLLILVFLGSRVLEKRTRPRTLLLLAASYWFYMAWSAAYAALLLFSTVLDYVVGAAIHRSDDSLRRRVLLGCSLVGNLGVLGVFKYYDWFVVNLADLLTGVGLEPSLPLLHLVLPVGISFFTFQSLSYTLDIYARRLEPCRSLVDFALFVSFFPQLVAGPIVRAREFLPQLESFRPATDPEQGSGLYLLLKGLVKKVVIADVLATFLVDPVFVEPRQYGTVAVLVAVYAFKFQIYCDFSGYTDIAIGVGRLLGFRLPTNFRSPYKATSVTNYWERWHITLGRWFRDYVFFPLGGSRHGLARTCVNLLLTMLLVGLWHGASGTFVLWGGYYGGLMCLERVARRGRPRPPEPVGWHRLLRVVWVFQLTAVGSLVFRSVYPANLLDLLGALGRPGGGATPSVAPPVWAVLAVAAVTHFLPESWKQSVEDRFSGLPAVVQALAALAVLVAMRLAGEQTVPFYYFQF